LSNTSIPVSNDIVLRESTPNPAPSTTAITTLINSNERRAHRHVQVATNRTPRFEGRCDDFKMFVYDSTDIRQANQYIKTTREIADYVGRTFKYGMDMRLSIENMEIYVISQPEDPPNNASRMEIRIWEKSVDLFVTRKTILQQNIKKTYSLIWGQCLDVMRQKFEAYPGYSNIVKTGDALALLQTIKNICYQFQVQKHLPQALHESKRRFYNCHQLRNQSVQAY
jgi:hypothetical protein